ncbi:uncharacterized protein B0H18DRAFT_674522 [Fomitopsis serialis]|uniref:uncharacterized protein n=1 Tax=Fomitopsis serialis TaxID=139415 RepID=UPI002007D097|nr:uncharacterized protein B0H18DRAFT_674522 [Neoantrodia serialis]KAH9933022.1 hypothetical protein B0H18DRAFT_674522 [Neoantrodia serialis]
MGASIAASKKEDGWRVSADGSERMAGKNCPARTHGQRIRTPCAEKKTSDGDLGRLGRKQHTPTAPRSNGERSHVRDRARRGWWQCEEHTKWDAIHEKAPDDGALRPGDVLGPCFQPRNETSGGEWTSSTREWRCALTDECRVAERVCREGQAEEEELNEFHDVEDKDDEDGRIAATRAHNEAPLTSAAQGSTSTG